MNTDSKYLDLLRTRLAKAEISTDEYDSILAKLQERPNSRTNNAASLGRIVAEVDNCVLYEDRIVHNNKTYRLSEVTSVSGMNYAFSMNFVPMQKTSHLWVSFTSGDAISLSEERALLGGKRHKAIRIFGAALQEMTFQSRLNAFAAKLVQQERLKIFPPYSTSSKEEDVYLTIDGKLTTASRSFDIRQSALNSAFGVGTTGGLPGRSYSVEPDEIAIADAKGFLGYIPNKALVFTPNQYDKDVVNALVTWFAKGNSLKRT